MRLETSPLWEANGSNVKPMAPTSAESSEPPVSLSDPCLADYSQVVIQGSRYKSVNFGTCEDPWLFDPLESLEAALKLAGYEPHNSLKDNLSELCG